MRQIVVKAGRCLAVFDSLSKKDIYSLESLLSLSTLGPPILYVGEGLSTSMRGLLDEHRILDSFGHELAKLADFL